MIKLLIIVIISLLLELWVIRMTNQKKLYVGFGVAWFILIIFFLAGFAFLSFQPVRLFNINIGTIFIVLLYIVFPIIIFMINLTKQISIISNRLTDVVQYIALNEKRLRDENE